MKKLLLALSICVVSLTNFAQNISTGVGTVGSIDSWKVSTTSPATGSTYVLPTGMYSGIWEPVPVPVTSAKWISLTPTGMGSGMTDYFYEKSFGVSSGIKEVKCNFKVAADDQLKKVELVDGSGVASNIPFTISLTGYRFTDLITGSVKCPKAGEWKLRITVFCGDPKGSQGATALLVSGNIDQIQGVCCDCTKPTNTNVNFSLTTTLGGGTTASASAMGASTGLGNGWTLKEVSGGAVNPCRWVPGGIKWQSTGASITIPAGVLVPGKCYVLTHYVNVCATKWDPRACVQYKTICFCICDNPISTSQNPNPNPQGLQKRMPNSEEDEILKEAEQLPDVNGGRG